MLKNSIALDRYTSNFRDTFGKVNKIKLMNFLYWVE